MYVHLRYTKYEGYYDYDRDYARKLPAHKYNFLKNKIKRETFFLFLVQCQRNADNIIIDFLLDPSSPYLGGSSSPVSGF